MVTNPSLSPRIVITPVDGNGPTEVIRMGLPTTEFEQFFTHHEPRLVEASPARKYDTGKPRWELLPVQAMEEVVHVLTYGAKKYSVPGESGDHNWRKGFEWSRLFGAASRHLFAAMRGEDRDPESGLLHLAHAACCILFLIEHMQAGLGRDDRYKAEESK